MEVEKFLNRIGYTGPVEPTDDVLNELHLRHVQQVPFENLDVYYGIRFNLDLEKIYQKVVIGRRGGFCYELNLLFNWLLTEIGFSSRIIAARILDEQGKPGPPFDHMCLLVKTTNEFLLDVGYGDLFLFPVMIGSEVIWDGRSYFRIEKWNERDHVISMSSDGINYVKRYAFNFDLAESADFDRICADKQINPNSYFVKNVVCTRPTKTGRVTIFNDKLIEKSGDSKIESLIDGDRELRFYLKEKFDIVIENARS